MLSFFMRHLIITINININTLNQVAKFTMPLHFFDRLPKELFFEREMLKYTLWCFCSTESPRS